MWEEQNFLDKAAITNLIAVGDSDAEMFAAKSFASGSDRCLIKLVKLRDDPTYDELKKELTVINSQFDYIFSSYKSMTLRLERAQ